MRCCNVSTVIGMYSAIFVCAAKRTKPRQHKVIHRSMRGAWKHLLSDALLQPWYCSGESVLALHIPDSDLSRPA